MRHSVQPRTWSTAQRRLRATVALGPVVAVLAASAVATGGPVPWWLDVVVVVLAAVSATTPDSVVLMVTDLVVVGVWIGHVGDLVPGWSVLAAGALAASHLAATVAGAGPPESRLDPRVVGLWCRRGGVLLAASVATWALAVLLRGRDGPEVLWPGTLLVVTAAAAAASVVLRPGQHGGPGRPGEPGAVGSGDRRDP